MNIYVPDYYVDFHCIASKCKHTCCAGWEIDIDEESLTRYEKILGSFGDTLRQAISHGDSPHFILMNHERCPLLNDENLCELIIHVGEYALCQICRDHPRFRNYFSSRIEMGLGLVCEEATRIILSQPNPLKLILLEGNGIESLTDDERYLLDLRNRWIKSISFDGPRARLLETLIYRHLPDALYDGRLEERISFIKHAFEAITEGWTNDNFFILIDKAREFSDHVEYDDEVLEDWISGNYT